MPQLLNRSLSWIRFSFMNMKMEVEGDLDLPARINLSLEAGGSLDYNPSCCEEDKGRGGRMKQTHRESWR